MAERLIIGAVSEDFDPARDLVLGPWCFVGHEARHPGWEDLPFIDAFTTTEEWVEADRATRALANALVSDWGERLNRRHGRSYSLRFWRVMLLNWLTVAIPPLWFRYRVAEETVRRHADQSLLVSVAADLADWAVPCSGDLLAMFWRPDMDFRLSSLVVAALCPPTWTMVTAEPPPPAARQAAVDAPASVESRAGRLLRRLFGRLPANFIPGARLWRLPISAFAALLPKGPASEHYDFDPRARDAFPPAFLALLDGFLERVLPRSFTDGFAALEERAAALDYHPGRLLLDTLNSEDDGVRTITALAHEHGERLVSCQHGGIYGTARAMMAAAETEYRYHGFLTWGWSAQEDYPGRFLPVPSPELSRIAGRHRETAAQLILVGSSMVAYGTRLGWLPKPQDLLTYRRSKLAFLGALDAPILAASAYRPYRRNVTVLEDGAFVTAAFPQLPLVNGDLTEALLKCRLAVIDHPITTILTVMAADVPSVFTWDPNVWPLARQAEPLFARLRAVGILHDDPEAAARHVNAVWNDVAGWWRRPDVKAARQAFVHAYARTSPVWWLYWLKALWRLSGRAPCSW